MNLKRLLGWPLWDRLDRLERELERVTLTCAFATKPSPPPVAERLDCGHTATGKMTKRDGTTQCPACHEADIRRDQAAARAAHEAREAARQAQVELDAQRVAMRRGGRRG